jgi:hypothetical protein
LGWGILEGLSLNLTQAKQKHRYHQDKHCFLHEILQNTFSV